MQRRAALIGPALGLRGEVHLDLRTDDPALLVPGVVLATNRPEMPEVTLVRLRRHKDRLIASFEEIGTRETAEAMRGAELLVDEHEEEDAWYPDQLRGLVAVAPNGEELGTVTDLVPGAAQDLLLVDHRGREVMVPFVRQLVPGVDVEAGRIVIDAPAGLFDESEAIDAVEEDA